MAMATALRKLSTKALRGQPLSRITPLYSMVRRCRTLLSLFCFLFSVMMRRTHVTGGLFLVSSPTHPPTERKEDSWRAVILI
jgi:hypothetical protein